MKKSIITLLALSGIATADIATWETLDGLTTVQASGTNVQNWDVTDSGLTWTKDQDESIFWTMNLEGLDTAAGTYTLLSIKDITYNGLANVYISGGNINVNTFLNNSSTNTKSTELVTGEAETLTFVLSRTSGNAVTLDVYIDQDFDTSLISDNSQRTNFSFSGKNFTNLYFGGNPDTIYGKGDAVVPRGDAAASWELMGAGYTVGSLVTSDQLKTYYATAVIPEPTTATLSLLALAGLAARRRRR